MNVLSAPSLAREVSRRAFLKRLGLAGAACWSFSQVGCRSGRPVLLDFSEGPRSFVASDYWEVFNQWTRHERLVSANEGTIIEIWATLKSWEYREAYVQKYAQMYALSTAAKAGLRASELKKCKESYELHLTVQTSDYRSNDLEKNDSPWRLSLVDGTGDEIFQKEVEALRLPIPYEEAFFPEKTSFSRAYTARFDREEPSQTFGFGGAASGEITLRGRGPLGGIELTWQAK